MATIALLSYCLGNSIIKNKIHSVTHQENMIAYANNNNTVQLFCEETRKGSTSKIRILWHYKSYLQHSAKLLR